jgi:uncharacterized membrane protein
MKDSYYVKIRHKHMEEKKKKKRENNIFGNISPIRDIMMQFVSSFLNNFIEQIQENIAERIEDIQADLKVKAKVLAKNATRTFIVFFLLTLGAIFLFLGLANVLDYIFKLEGVGFLLVGAVIVTVGFIVSSVGKKRV